MDGSSSWTYSLNLPILDPYGRLSLWKFVATTGKKTHSIEGKIILFLSRWSYDWFSDVGRSVEGGKKYRLFRVCKTNLRFARTDVICCRCIKNQIKLCLTVIYDAEDVLKLQWTFLNIPTRRLATILSELRAVISCIAESGCVALVQFLLLSAASDAWKATVCQPLS